MQKHGEDVFTNLALNSYDNREETRYFDGQNH